MKNKKILLLCFVSLLAFSAIAQIDSLSIAKGKFKATDESLEQYQYPEWFRDAKFGIWSHWGPQAVPRMGDWYARKLYISNTWDSNTKSFSGAPDPDYVYHLAHYGHPSVFGFKDIIPLWKAEKWNPDSLMKLYKKVGAKYFVSMGIHHDNFSLWNTKLNRWNAVNMGPHKDIVAIWQKAAQKEGLRFGISEHLAGSYNWYQTSHGADNTGDKAGVPYDGNDPQYQDLYHDKSAPEDTQWTSSNPARQLDWFNRIKELVDMYKPDLLYSDSELPFKTKTPAENNVARSLVAHFYNENMAKYNGKLEAVYNCKEPSRSRFVQDIEQGLIDSISPYPWQTDTSIGDWFYRTGQKYKTSNEITQMLVDIVSKNGNLLLNAVQTPEGNLEPDVLEILDGIGTWIKDNGEGIYSTRPWKIYGEGPSTIKKQEKGKYGGIKDVRTYQPTDIRFTTKNGTLFAFCMDKPTANISILSLGKTSKISNQKVASVSMLGSNEKLKWKQEDNALVIQKPVNLPAYQVVAFQIMFK